MDERHEAEDNNAFLASDLLREFNSHLLITSILDTIFKKHKVTKDLDLSSLPEDLNLAVLRNKWKKQEKWKWKKHLKV